MGWVVFIGLVFGYCRTKFLYFLLLLLAFAIARLFQTIHEFPHSNLITNARDTGYLVGSFLGPFILGTIFYGIGRYFGKKDSPTKQKNNK